MVPPAADVDPGKPDESDAHRGQAKRAQDGGVLDFLGAVRAAFHDKLPRQG